MTTIGSGYDLSAGTFSPEGKVFQVEYAAKAVESNSGTVIGLRCKDGVVVAVEKLIRSQMLEPGSNKRVNKVSKNIGAAIAGIYGDAREICKHARSEAKNYEELFGNQITTKVLADKLALQIHQYTLNHRRPYGISTILAGFDINGPQLYMIEPSGTFFGYFGAACGKGKQAAKTEIEKLNLKELTVRQGIVEAAKIIYTVHDEIKDKLFELELGWIAEETGKQFQLVPQALFDDAVAAAKQAIAAEAGFMEDDDDE